MATQGEGTRVLIVDDHELLAHVLATSLADAGFWATAVTGAGLDDVLTAAREVTPDVALLDLDLGRNGDGRALVEPLTDLGCRVIMLTGSRDAAAIGEGIERGACGVLSKETALEALVAAVEQAAAGVADALAADKQRCLQARRQQLESDRQRLAPFERLTPREEEVLAALRLGRSASAIADTSFVSLSTVRSQIRSILTKLGVSSQLAAVALANEAGWS